MLKQTLQKLWNNKQEVTFCNELKQEIGLLQSKLAQYEMGWPPGHFYSPIPSLAEISSKEEAIWGKMTKNLLGINLNENAQLELLNQLSTFYKNLPWQATQQKHLRYYFDNPNYTYGESIMLSCLLQHLQPKQIIEIGSGYSSCVIMDTDELFLNNAISKTFIEPYPQLLQSLLKPTDLDNIQIISSNLQDVLPSTYKGLSAGDILFIDSTHVSKINSDVNHIFFDILPQLNSGVYIHFHDIYYPFEYPKEWIYQGRAWNEAYILRAFLQHNDAFEIVLFNSFIGQFHHDLLQKKLPLMASNPGSSIWIRKK